MHFHPSVWGVLKMCTQPSLFYGDPYVEGHPEGAFPPCTLSGFSLVESVESLAPDSGGTLLEVSSKLVTFFRGGPHESGRKLVKLRTERAVRAGALGNSGKVSGGVRDARAYCQLKVSLKH